MLEIYFPFNKELKGHGRNCLSILLRITVVKIIAGSESNKHYPCYDAGGIPS
jgi:hypothetical protein